MGVFSVIIAFLLMMIVRSGKKLERMAARYLFQILTTEFLCKSSFSFSRHCLQLHENIVQGIFLNITVV